MRSPFRAGFTIVELLIVVVVIAILAAITVVAYNGINTRARESTLTTNLSTIAKQLEFYKIKSGNSEYSLTFSAAGISEPDTGTWSLFSEGSSFCVQVEDSDLIFHITNDLGSPIPGPCEGAVANQPNDCPSGFIPVPGFVELGTQGGFCVMKFEAKIKGKTNGYITYYNTDIPESRSSGTPWIISWTNALDAVGRTENCDGCHMITEAEWMTIAANVLLVPENWSSGTVGNGYIYQGHIRQPSGNLAGPDPANDEDYHFGLTTVGTTAGTNARRTLKLTNGEVIWDFVGNVLEWTTGTVSGTQAGSGWVEWNSVTSWGNLSEISRPSSLASIPGLENINSWTTANGMGHLYGNPAATGVYRFSRGGTMAYGSSSGLFFLMPSQSSGASQGFRVAR